MKNRPTKRFNRMINCTIICTVFSMPFMASAQLDIIDIDSGAIDAQDVAQNLLGPNNTASISNLSITGDERCIGSFTGGSNLGSGALGFDSGIILGSGSALDAVGPNISDETTTEFYTPGDNFLGSLIPDEDTYDACVLEFDFECTDADSVSVEYVMASEEFNEFVGDDANDVFGFALNSSNIATIPESNGLPVAISSINCGNPYDANSTEPYCHLFINNDLEDGGGNIDIEADGLTTVLTAEAALNPGVNHMKFAVADVLDETFDTWVFLKSGSFQCATTSEPPTLPDLLMSISSCRAYAAALRLANEDIFSLDEETNTVEQVFDGSDVGLAYTGVDAFANPRSDDLFMSISKPIQVASLGLVGDEDILRFTPATLGDDTSGSFDVYFDGSANDLPGSDYDIDAFHIDEGTLTGNDDDGDGIPNEQDACPLDSANDSDGDGICGNTKLYFSFRYTVPIMGAWYPDEDIIQFDEATSTYSRIFDGSDVGLAHADVDAIRLMEDGSILLSFKCTAEVPGLGRVRDEDLVRFIPTSLGDNTAGVFEMYLVGATTGIQGRRLDFDAVDYTHE